MKAQKKIRIQKKNKIMFLFFFFYFISCENKVEENLLIEYFSDSKSTLKSEYIIKNGDTLSHGLFKSYNEKNTINGEGEFFEGKLNGKIINYFDNGSIKTLRHYDKGKPIGESLYYNEGNKLEQYVLYNNKNEIGLIINFDKDGKYLNHKGSLFVDWIYGNNKPSELKINDTIKYGFIIPEIQDVNREFTVELLDYKYNDRIKRTIEKIDPVGVFIKEKVVKKGKNIYRGKVKLEFDNTTTIIDSLDLIYNIK